MTQSCCPLVLVLPTNTTGTGHPQHSKAPPWTPRCHRLSWKVAPFWSAVRRCTARTHWVSTNFARATFDFTTLQQFYFTFCRIQICESSPSGETFCLFTTHALCTLFSQGFYLQSQNAVVKPQHCLAKRRKTSRPSSKTQRSEMLIRVMMNFAKIKVLLSSLTRCFRASWPGTKKIRHPNPKAWRFVQTNESSTRMTPSLHFFFWSLILDHETQDINDINTRLSNSHAPLFRCHPRDFERLREWNLLWEVDLRGLCLSGWDS